MPPPTLKEISSKDDKSSISWIEAEHANLGRYLFGCDDADTLLFTENETNNERLHGSSNQTLFVKDAFHGYVIEGRSEAVNPECVGTKVAALYQLDDVPAGYQAMNNREAIKVMIEF